MDEVEKEIVNSPEFTYRVKYQITGSSDYEIAFIHADHYEYDKDCVSFFTYAESIGDQVICSSIKGWFCIERKDFDKESQEDAIDELRDIFIRLDEAFAKYGEKGD